MYNYIVSNHHGESTPSITHGFNRTFGPQHYFFNSGQGSTLKELKKEAEALADPHWNTEFYDSIAKYVIGYVASSQRGSVDGG